MLYPFEDIKDNLHLTEQGLRYHLKKHDLQYVKMGHKRFFTKEQLDEFYSAVFEIRGANECSQSTKEKKHTTSVVLSPMVTEWLQSGELQARLTNAEQKKSVAM